MTPANPPTAPAPNIFDKILLGLEIATEVMAVVPVTAPFAAIALQLEKITGASIKALAASKGQTVEDVIKELHTIALIE